MLQNPKRGRYCFELRMAGGKGYSFSADNEEEMNDWITAFNAALKKNQDNQESHQNDEVLDKGILAFHGQCLISPPIVVRRFIVDCKLNS